MSDILKAEIETERSRLRFDSSVEKLVDIVRDTRENVDRRLGTTLRKMDASTENVEHRVFDLLSEIDHVVDQVDRFAADPLSIVREEPRKSVVAVLFLGVLVGTVLRSFFENRKSRKLEGILPRSDDYLRAA